MRVTAVCEIPKKTGIYKELLAIDYIGVTDNGNVINLVENREIEKYEHEKYYSVNINGSRYYIHRLVALLYVNERDRGNVVFHINKNTLDNRHTNLMWTTQSFVSRTRQTFEKTNVNRKVALLGDHGEVVKIYKTGGEASRDLGLNRSEIYRVCKNKRRHVGGYKFKYIE